MSVDDNNEYEVLKLPASKRNEDEIEYIPIFELDDRVYEVPKKPSAGLMLKFLKIRSKEGEDVAMYWMLERMLGEEAYDALADHENLDSDVLPQIIELCQSHLLGQTKDPNEVVEEGKAKAAKKAKKA